MIEFSQCVSEHFAKGLGSHVDDINLDDLMSQKHDIIGVVEDHQEWFDAIYPSRIGEVLHVYF